MTQAQTAPDTPFGPVIVVAALSVVDLVINMYKSITKKRKRTYLGPERRGPDKVADAAAGILK